MGMRPLPAANARSAFPASPGPGACAVRVAGRELLASAGDDGTARVWAPATGAADRVLEGHTRGVSEVCTVRVGERAIFTGPWSEDPTQSECMARLTLRQYVVLRSGAPTR
jgi:hypothetical protein